MTATPCSCAPAATYCPRHRRAKTDLERQLCLTDAAYRARWDAIGARGRGGHEPARVRPPCTYLDARRILDRRGCICPTKWVRGCELHERCTMAESVEGVACCATCGDYEPVSGPTPATTSEPITLACRLSPGDIVTMTAAVRELHAQYPGRYRTAVDTPCPDLWRHNPHVVPIEPGARRIELRYSDGYANIHRSNQHAIHFIAGYCEDLGRQLALPAPLRPSRFAGDVYLADHERAAPPAVEAPYWLVMAGGKRDYTAKRWPAPHYQAVIAATRDRVRWVQVGALEAGHEHEALEGVIDLRGRTTLRDLVLLVHHAAGVLCGVTLAMHLAAAVPRPEGVGGLRPCVVVGGGREPVHWYQYPGHTVFHSIGQLDCCESGACWRSRVVPLGDGSPLDGSLCARPIGDVAECMIRTPPHHVADAILAYEHRA